MERLVARAMSIYFAQSVVIRHFKESRVA